MPVEDRWIISRLNHAIASATDMMQNFQFGEAQRTVYDFLWGEYCDWYIEMAKVRMRSAEAVSPIPVLINVLETSAAYVASFHAFRY